MIKAVQKLERRSLTDLKPHPQNAEIYGDPDPGLLAAMVAEFEADASAQDAVPLVVTHDNVILSGHTRAEALGECGGGFAAVFVIDTKSKPLSEDERLAKLLSYNEQRQKTNLQKARECRTWREIESKRAAERKSANGGNKTGGGTGATSGAKARDAVGAHVGWGGRTVDMALKVLDKLDEIESKGGDGAALLEELERGVKPAFEKFAREPKGPKIKPLPFDENNDGGDEAKPFPLWIDDGRAVCKAIANAIQLLREDGYEDAARAVAQQAADNGADAALGYATAAEVALEFLDLCDERGEDDARSTVDALLAVGKVLEADETADGLDDEWCRAQEAGSEAPTQEVIEAETTTVDGCDIDEIDDEVDDQTPREKLAEAIDKQTSRRAMLQQLGKLESMWRKASARDPWTSQVDDEVIREMFARVGARLTRAEPAAVCPDCHKGRKAGFCSTCADQGWINKERFDKLPAKVRKELEAL